MWDTGLGKAEGSHGLMEVLIPCLSEAKDQTHPEFSLCTPPSLLWHLEEQQGCLSSLQRCRLQRAPQWDLLFWVSPLLLISPDHILTPQWVPVGD